MIPWHELQLENLQRDTYVMSSGTVCTQKMSRKDDMMVYHLFEVLLPAGACSCGVALGCVVIR